ncbi:hypothetical protein SAMN05216338_107815 [Bradyrhizobium sp. Rc2d]|uniref:hypothetical protein n=1 Tax=Bradyrhizobium sp. Rc2d TaxID=1855321 RepID=UPI0008806EB3|nr:hypothetical protein [Bradyrhizobium sp. Rc2d]SDJ99126.1 hypothetical protein SAMN05216338_107815 [Bradyrhizobium sp. Rc2d]
MKVVCLRHATSDEVDRIRAALPVGTEVVAPQGGYFSRFDCSSDIAGLAADADAFIGFSFNRS